MGTEEQQRQLSGYDMKLVSSIDPIKTGVSIVPLRHLTTIDGVTVTKEVARFAAEIRAKMPRVKFGNTGLQTRLYVYLPGTVYVLGEIGVSLGGGRGGRNNYHIRSPRIRNNKHRKYQYHGKYYTQGSVNRSTAVRKAVKVLVPFTPMEIMWVTSEGVGYKVRNSSHIRVVNVETCQRDIGYSAEFWNELSQIYKRGDIKFTDANVVGLMDKWVNAIAEKTDADTHYNNNSGYFVTTERRFNREITRVIRFADIQDTTHNSAEVEIEEDSEVYEGVKGKIALLNMTEVGTFIEGVGYRVEGGSYYVVD